MPFTFQKFVTSDDQPYKGVRLSLVAIFIGVSLGELISGLQSVLSPPQIFQRDFNQAFYAAGRAILTGESPYIPIPELVHRHLGSELPGLIPHATPYPPFSLVLLSPLSLLPSAVSGWVWAGISLGAAFIAIRLTTVLAGSPLTRFHTILVIGLLSWWNFFREDIRYGNNGLFMFALVAWIIYALLAGRFRMAGVVTGLVCAFKFAAFPFALILLLRKHYEELKLGALTFLLCNLLAVPVIGWAEFLRYYSSVAGEAGRFWSTCIFNISIFASVNKFRVPSLMAPGTLLVMTDPAPQVGLLFGAGLFLAVLGLFVYRASHEELGSASVRASALCVIGVPVAWIYYEAFLLIPLTVMLIRSYKGAPRASDIALSGLISFQAFFDLLGYAVQMVEESAHDSPAPAPIFALLICVFPTLVSLVLLAMPRNYFKPYRGVHESTTAK